MIINIKNNNLDDVKDGVVLVDFYATWCGPCKMMHPIVDIIALENDDLKILKVDVDENEELARKYGIMSVPTFIILKNGEVKEKKIGYIPKEELEKLINNI